MDTHRPYKSPLAKAYVPHSLATQAEEALLESLEDPNGEQIPLLIGAPGFGKTTLLTRARNAVAWRYREAMAADPNLRPVTGFEALAPIRGNYDIRTGFLTILSDLGDSGVEYRIGHRLDAVAALQRQPLSGQARDVSQLQADVVRAIGDHRTVAMFIDEINHFVYVNDTARYAATLDILKSITNQTGVRIVCAGSYDAIGFLHVSGQSIRRQAEIHLHRYRADRPAEFKEYTRVVHEMLAILGYEDDPAPVVRVAYQRSIGTIGSTRDLLVRADHAAHYHGESLLHGLARKSRSDQATLTMARQIVDGERDVDAQLRDELDQLIGLATVPDPIPAPTKRRKRERPRKPGQRSLGRDLVGQHAS